MRSRPLTSRVISEFIIVAHSWWLGLTDEQIEGTWKWLDNGQIANFTGLSQSQSYGVP
jgi:hypothetical protein